MINSKPKSAVLERMGCDSAVLARQLYVVALGNFRNILPRARVSQLSSWLYLNKDDRNIAGIAVVISCEAGSDYWQLPRAARLLSPKADFLRSNVTLRGNTPLSLQFQGESR